MKKIFLSLSLMMAVAATSLARDPGTEEAFKKEFPGVEEVSWSYQDGYQKATFILAGHRTIAYFDENNVLAGCIRDIFYDQLPITVMKAVDKKFPSASFSEVREITNAEGTFYLVTAEQEEKKYKVKISSEGSFSEIEKVSK